MSAEDIVGIVIFSITAPILVGCVIGVYWIMWSCMKCVLEDLKRSRMEKK